MSDLSIQGEVVVNSEKAESAFDRVGDRASQMANEVATSAGKAGQAVDKIGDGAGASAEKFTRAESRISASIKRATNELELLGKTASQRLEFNIADKGLDAAKFEPALKKLRELEAQAQQAQRAASGSLDKMGISAAQTAAALRGVPAQFSDIITSLQGGQAPMTVLLQQGGQLKDMFGGVGNAARALGGYVVGLINPFTLTAAAVAGIAVAYNQGSKEAEAFNKTLILTGNAAGVSADTLSDMARAIDATSNGITQSKAAEVLNSIAASGDVASDKLQRYAKTAIEFERAGGGAADEVAKAFSSLAGDPLAAVEKLNKSTNFLTAEIYNQIKALEDEGRSTDAARLAQDSYASMLDQRIPKLRENLGLLERGWISVKGAAAEAWDAMLNVGRAATMGESLKKLEQELQNLNIQAPNAAANSIIGQQKARLIEQIAGTRELMETQRKSDEQQRQNNLSTQAALDLSKQATKYDTDLEKQRKAVAQATEKYNQALAAGNLGQEARAQLEKDYLKTVAGITAAKETRAAATKKENKDLEAQSRVFAELAGVSSTYYKDLAAAQEQRAKGNISEAQYIAYVNELIQKQPFAVALAKEETEARKLLNQQILESAKAYEAAVNAMDAQVESAWKNLNQYTTATEEQAAALEFELGLMGKSASARALEIEQYKIQIRLKQDLKRIAETPFENETQRAAAVQQATETAAKASQNAITKSSIDAAKEAEDEWKKTSQQINQSLTDALMRGFESGKDFAKNLRDTIKNMFSTLVLRPIISAVVNPVAGAITGALGLAGTAKAGTSALSTVGSIGSGYSLLSGMGAFGGGISGGFGGLMGSLGLSATGSTLGGALSAGSIALQSGNILGGLGTFVGALGPIALGLGALTSLLGSFKGETRTGGQFGVAFDGAVTNQRRDQTYTIQGQQFDRDFTNGQRTALTTGQAYRLEGDPVAQEQAIRDAVSGTAKTINALLKTLGSQAALTGFSAGLETSGKGRGGVFAGGLLSNGASFGESGKGDNYAGTLYEKFSTTSPDFKQALTDFTLDLKQSTIQALQSVADIPKSVKAIVSGVDAEALTGEAANALLTTINAQINGVNQLKTAFAAIGLDKIAALSFDAASGLAAAAGGFEALQGNLNSYYENFYTEAEKTANVTRSVSQALAAVGLEMPKTREEFRALVDGQLALGEAGAPAVAALLGVSGAFASVVPAAEALNTASKAAKEHAATRAGLERKLLELQGDAAALRQLDIAGMDDYNIALYDQIQALTKANEVSAERKTLQDRFDAVTMTSTRLREKERSAIDAANRSLYDMVTALENLAAVNVKNATDLDGFKQTFQTPEKNKADAKTRVEKVFSSLDIKGIPGLDDYIGMVNSAKLTAEKWNKLLTEAAAPDIREVIKLAAKGGWEGIDATVRENITKWTDSVGIARPDTLEQYDAILRQGTSLATNASQRLADLLSIKDDYALINNVSQGVVQAPAAPAAQTSSAVDDGVERIRRELEGKIFQLLNAGDIAKLRQREIDALDVSLRPLQQRIYAIEDAGNAVDKALTSVDRAINAEKTRIQSDSEAQIAAIRAGIESRRTALDAAQKQVNELEGIFDSVTQAVKKLRGDLDPERNMTSARAYIDMALSLARAGTMPDAKKLQDAISTVTSDTAQAYASMADFAFAQKVQAGKLDELGQIAGAQKSAAALQLDALKNANDLAEKQIKAVEKSAREQITALDLQLKAAQDQVSVMRGVDLSVQSVRDAVSGLQGALGSLSGLTGKPVPALPASLTQAGGGDSFKQHISIVSNMTDETFARAAAMVASGGSAAGSPVYEAIVNDPRWAGKFAGGGYYPGGLALVGEEGPEIINFAQPGQVYTAPQTRELLNGGGRMEQAFAAMAQQIAALQAEVRELRRSTDRGNAHTEVVAKAFQGQQAAPLLMEIA